jgi:hypothetical protein
MGISIFLEDERKQLRSKRYPLKVTWRFTCDGFHGFMDKPSTDFISSEKDKEYSYTKAMRAGWKESFYRGERKFYCPDCSGKETR